MSGYQPPNRAAVAKSMWLTWTQPSLWIRERKNESSLQEKGIRGPEKKTGPKDETEDSRIGRKEDGEVAAVTFSTAAQLVLHDLDAGLERVDQLGRRVGRIATGPIDRFPRPDMHADKLFPPRADQGREQLVRDVVHVRVEVQVLADVGPHGTVGREFLDRVRRVELAVHELDDRDVEQVVEAHDLLVRIRRPRRFVGKGAPRRLVEPLRVVLQREDLDPGERDRRLGRDGSLELTRVGPKVGLDVVPREGARVPPPPTRQLLLLRAAHVGDLDVAPLHERNVGAVGKQAQVEEIGQGYVAAFAMRRSQFSSARAQRIRSVFFSPGRSMR